MPTGANLRTPVAALQRSTAIFAEQSFQLGVLGTGYVIGAAWVLLILRFVGYPLAITPATLFVLALPLVSTGLAEAFVRLWLHTPGAVGMGGLTVFVPMLIAGAVSLVGAFGGQQILAPVDATAPRGSQSLTGWLVLAVLCSLFALALWRFWPAPRARLFL